MATVTPHIVVRGAGRAAEWYERALGAKIGSRIPTPDGRFMQIELLFDDSPVMIADEFPEFGAVSPLTLGGTHGALTITTDSVDELWQRAAFSLSSSMSSSSFSAALFVYRRRIDTLATRLIPLE